MKMASPPFERVSRLIEGFESPFGLELLATVHWVVDREGPRTVPEAVGKVHGWSPRKAMFTPHQIQAAWDRLHRLGWTERASQAGADA